MIKMLKERWDVLGAGLCLGLMIGYSANINGAAVGTVTHGLGETARCTPLASAPDGAAEGETRAAGSTPARTISQVQLLVADRGRGRRESGSTPAGDASPCLRETNGPACPAVKASAESDAGAHVSSLLAAIAEVESVSSGGDAAYRKDEQARGRYQIRPCYWQDAMEYGGASWPHTDAHDPVKARQAVLWYWDRYRLATDEARARGHNGGGINGPKIQATIPYWHKVQEAMK